MASEKRLIDANALKEYLNSIEASGGHKYYRKGMDDVLHFHIRNIQRSFERGANHENL